MNHKRTQSGQGFMIVGLLLMAAALFLAGFNLWDDWRAGEAAKRILAALPLLEEVQPAEASVADWDKDKELPQVKTVDGNCVGLLDVPALNLTLPVLDSCTVQQLRAGPCRYNGTPCRKGFVVAGHNYRTHFGALENLKTGDCVYFTDLEGNRFSYTVTSFQVLEEDAVEQMLSDEWDLTLFTCTYSGQTRFTVRCLLSDE